jgi:spore coat protein U-like protein
VTSGTQLLVAAALCAGLPVSAVMAATQTTTFPVTARVAAECQIDSADDLNFGLYIGRRVDAKSDIAVTCTRSTTYDVGLDAGTSQGATVTTRKMTGPGGDTLAYALYSDSARRMNWGNTVGVDTVSGAGNGRRQRLTVYGRVDSGQESAPGDYTDTIAVTLTF